MVGCWTGLRFSDFSRIEAENIQTNTITIKTQKTGKLVIIPIHWTLKMIMSKYKRKTANSLPPSISQQKLNTYIKEVGEKVGLKEMVMISKIKGGKRIDNSFPKYKLITTHTARRSFATNAFKNGIPSIAIMKITGHTTEKAFLKYIKISEKENAEMLLQHDFFKQRPQLKIAK